MKLEEPDHKIPSMGFVARFLTDPWETGIELTERSAESTSAHNQKRARP